MYKTGENQHGIKVKLLCFVIRNINLILEACVQLMGRSGCRLAIISMAALDWLYLGLLFSAVGAQQVTTTSSVTALSGELERVISKVL